MSEPIDTNKTKDPHGGNYGTPNASGEMDKEPTPDDQETEKVNPTSYFQEQYPNEKKGGVEDGPKIVAQGEKQVISNNVTSQYIYFSEHEEIKIETYLDNVRPIGSEVPLWEEFSSDYDKLCYNENYSILLDSKILFFSSDKYINRWSLYRNISLKDEFKSHEKKILYFPDIDSNKYLGIGKLINLVKEKKKHLIVADLNQIEDNEFHKAFFKSLTNQYRSDDLNILKEKDITIVVLIDNFFAAQIRNPQNKQFQRSFHIWGIDDIAKIKPEEEFEKFSPIHKTILYVAAFFKEISFRNFNSLVEYLLKRQPYTEQLVLQLYKNFKSKGAKEVKLVLDEDCTEVWNKYKDRLLRECYLLGKSYNGKYVIEFNYPGLREQTQKYFREKEHFFLQQQFKIFEHERFFFNPAIENEVADNLIEIIIESFLDDPFYYDNKWFRSIIYAIKDFEGRPFSAEGESDDDKIQKFWEFLERNDLVQFYYTRLVSIIKKMLGSVELVDKVQEYLLSLKKHKEYHALLVIVKQLPHSERFNIFYWLELLNEKGSREIGLEVYDFLLTYMGRLYTEDTFTAIKAWMPKEDEMDVELYSVTNIMAAVFVVHFCVNGRDKVPYKVPYINEKVKYIAINEDDEDEKTFDIVGISNFHFNDCGLWPSKYILFSADENKDGLDLYRQRIEFFISSFFHSGVRSQFTHSNVNLLTFYAYSMHFSKEMKTDFYVPAYTPTYNTLIADIIEAWFHILRGFGEKYVDGDAEKLNDLIMKKVYDMAETHYEDINAIINHWKNKPEIYRKELARLRDLKNEHTDTKYLKAIDEFIISVENRIVNISYLFDSFNKSIKNEQ